MKLITWPYYSEEFLKSQGFSKTFVLRFWSKIRKTKTCWLWTGAHDDYGYGAITKKGKAEGTIRPHRASWILHYGDIPAGFLVCHRCDVPDCVRPSHLFLGTAQDNTNDMLKKGRHWTYGRCGKDNPVTKFSYETVKSLRRAYETGTISMQRLGREFGISLSHTSRIIRGSSRVHS